MYLTKLTAEHSLISDWAEKYLTTNEYRFQNLLLPHLYENSTSIYNNAYRESKIHILFRAKVSYPLEKKLELINIWDSKESYENFSSLVDRDRYMEAFTSAGIVFRYDFQELSQVEATDIINQILLKENKIIQRYDPIFGLYVGPVGDPLKGDIV
jgi:hypothetical protein